MIRRLLFLIFAAIAAYIWLRRLWARPAAAARRTGQPAGSVDAGKVMVRDRGCNTFLPRSRAIPEPTPVGASGQRDGAGEPVSHSGENVPDPTH